MPIAKKHLNLILPLFLLTSCNSETNKADIAFQSFDDIYEPSGIVQLDDGHLLIAEDEKGHPFSLLQLSGQSSFQRLPLSLIRTKKSGKKKKIKLDDIEGLTLGNNGWVYAITSHSKTSKGNRKKKRERLVRFRISDGQFVDYQQLPSLTDYLDSLIPHKSLKKLNIEGLAYDKDSDSLLLGFRRPLLNKQALVIKISNLDVLFESKKLNKMSAKFLALDLQGKSIRSIEYDPILQGYIIVAGSKKDRKSPFRLWLWKDNQLKTISISGLNDIGYTEGISHIKDINNKPALLLVRDDGQRGKSAAHYLIVSYDRLLID